MIIGMSTENHSILAVNKRARASDRLRKHVASDTVLVSDVVAGLGTCEYAEWRSTIIVCARVVCWGVFRRATSKSRRDFLFCNAVTGRSVSIIPFFFSGTGGVDRIPIF